MEDIEEGMMVVLGLLLSLKSRKKREESGKKSMTVNGSAKWLT